MLTARVLSFPLCPWLMRVVMYHHVHGDERPQMKSGQATMNRFLAGIERRAFRMAQIATGNEDVALDIVQDSMLQLVRRYADRPEEELGPLFHTILHNRLRDWHRRASVTHRLFAWLKPVEEDVDPVQSLPDRHQADPESAQSLTESMDGIMACIRDLPMRQQQCFMLRAWEEYDVRETAAIMGCSEGSVKTHYSRAIRSLQQMLEASEDG